MYKSSLWTHISPANQTLILLPARELPHCVRDDANFHSSYPPCHKPMKGLFVCLKLSCKNSTRYVYIFGKQQQPGINPLSHDAGLGYAVGEGRICLGRGKPCSALPGLHATAWGNPHQISVLMFVVSRQLVGTSGVSACAGMLQGVYTNKTRKIWKKQASKWPILITPFSVNLPSGQCRLFLSSEYHNKGK